MPPRFLFAPDWGLIRNDQVNLMIEKRLEQINTWQGRNYEVTCTKFPDIF
jgi:radical SAM superfamily enzyme